MRGSEPALGARSVLDSGVCAAHVRITRGATGRPGDLFPLSHHARMDWRVRALRVALVTAALTCAPPEVARKLNFCLNACLKCILTQLHSAPLERRRARWLLQLFAQITISGGGGYRVHT